MGKLKIHAICVALFLVFGHVAMIAGMVDPSILGYKAANAHQMSSGGDDHEYCHPEEHDKMMRQHQQMMGNMPSGQMPMGGGQMPMGNGQMPMNGGQMPGQMKNGQAPMNNQGHNH